MLRGKGQGQAQGQEARGALPAADLGVADWSQCNVLGSKDDAAQQNEAENSAGKQLHALRPSAW